MTNVGTTSILGSTLDCDGNSKYVAKNYCGVAERVIGAYLYCSAPAGSATFKIICYDKDPSNNYPVNLEGTSDEKVLASGAGWGWVYIPFSTPFITTAGVYYYFGPHCEDTYLNIRYSTGATNDSYEKADTYSDGAADPWSALGSGAANRHISVYLVTEPLNSPPDTPAILYPTGNVSIDVDEALVVTWEHNDPDSDPQSGYNHRYRIVGDPAWTELGAQVSANEFHTYSDGTFTPGEDYEHQAKTQDPDSEWGDWSASSYFHASEVPATATIDAPIGDEVITASSYTVEWTVTDQDAYQLRTVADSGGSPDTGTTYEDTGVVVDDSAREASIDFGTNNRTEHVQLRVRYDGLWSEWDSVKVSVEYVAPRPPLLTVTEDDDNDCLVVDVEQQEPMLGTPTATSTDIYRSEDDVTYIRIAGDLDPDVTYSDYAVAANQGYYYKAKATDADGLYSWDGDLAWVTVAPTTDSGWEVYDA